MDDFLTEDYSQWVADQAWADHCAEDDNQATNEEPESDA